MIAIETKYHGATNTKGSRYSASTCNGQKLTMSTDYSLDSDANHERVACALAGKMAWFGEGARKYRLVGGSTKSGMVFVFVAC